MKTIVHFLSNLYIVLILVVIICSIGLRLSGKDDYMGYQFRVVTSDSMEPTIRQNDLVIIKRANESDIKLADIVTVKAGEDYVTHRVISSENTRDGTQFETKGDANEVPDFQLVSPANIVGKVDYYVPYVGIFFLLVQTSRGFIAYIMTMFVLLLVSYFLKLVVKESSGYQKEERHKDKKGMR